MFEFVTRWLVCLVLLLLWGGNKNGEHHFESTLLATCCTDYDFCLYDNQNRLA